MDEARIAATAEELLGAYESGVPVDPPAKSRGLPLEEAYAVQLAQVKRWMYGGARIAGHKVGLTSAPMREQMGVDQPDYGHLMESMFHLERQPIATSAFLQPRVEPEVAFVLAKPLTGPGVTAADAMAAVDFVVPALEIIDSRIKDWKISLPDTIADNASSGGVVLGSRPVRLGDVDLADSQCMLTRSTADGEVDQAGAGSGGAVLGTPLNALVWLANTLGALGSGLSAGHVILPGSITASVPVTPGDTFTATMSGLGDVTATFT